MYFIILKMSDTQKLIDNAFRGDINLNNLFDTALTLLDSSDQKSIHKFLTIGHISYINRTIYQKNKINEWFDLLHQLIMKSKFDVYELIKQRAEYYENKPLFQDIIENKVVPISYRDVWKTLQYIGSYFATNLSKNDTIGILTPNRLNGALIDLACICYHIRVVPIPINLSADHLDYVLDHADITHLFTGSEDARDLLNNAKIDTNALNMVCLDIENEWEDFLKICYQSTLTIPNKKEMDDLATIMYTSGTTDNPKGIIFNQTNIITKRFARALALPEIGSNDSFLCYLPLYHTFGRWLEMMGTIFWGSTYTFTENTSFKTLLRDFKIAKPTVFISIPKRWIQIYEHVAATIPIEMSEEKAIKDATQSITGENLKWGLSAAGFLDTDIFKFFHQNDINLMSGYGMTEATGGITMTPPKDYIANSVGKVLPGIELKLGEDDELLMRGPYVSPGYYKDEIAGSHINGWFYSGDIFRYKKGHYFIVDRKKEIYKNSRGETISPQKIENLFQDFESIRSVFLVGDGQEFNTILLYPEPNNDAVDLNSMSPEEIRIYFSSLVFSVNTFLPPHERIINYAVIQRDFDHEHDELTPKNTYKRKNVLKNFTDIITPMYEKNYISLIHGDYEIQIPNWLLREKRLTRGDIRWDGKSIREYDLDDGLPLKWTKSGLRIGDFIYYTDEKRISFENLIRDPILWLGNNSLVDFINEVSFRVISLEPYHILSLNHAKLPFNKKDKSLINATSYPEGAPTLVTLHLAAANLFQNNVQHVKSALDHLHQGINSATYQTIIQDQLLRLQFHPDSAYWARALEILMPHISGEMFISLYKKSIYSSQYESMSSFHSQFIQKHHFQSILELLADYRQRPKIAKKDVNVGQALINLITDLGMKEPKYFTKVRGELNLWMLSSKNHTLAELAHLNRDILLEAFRTSIRTDQFKDQFDWSSILQFDQNIPDFLKEKIETAIHQSTLIRESIFILSDNQNIQLSDLVPGGLWFTLIGKGHGKYVIRVLAQLKNGGAHNFVLNINDDLPHQQFTQETNWLISIASSIQDQKLVEDFGSYWEDHQIFTEEYISGETVMQYLNRNQKEISSGTYIDRWQMRWLHFIWNGVTAYLEFWKRTGCTRMITDASPRNIIIPEFDYYTGTRLISISGRKKTTLILDVFLSLYEKFILETERKFPGLKKMAEWEILFTVTLEVFGLKVGSKMLRTIKKSHKNLKLSPARVKEFLNEVNKSGLLRKQVVFASLRYQRWLDLNAGATYKARGIIIQDLYKDYKLQVLMAKYPETRIRFFLMTAFQDANTELVKKLNDLMKEMRSGSISEENLETHLHFIHDEIDLNEEEKYFLTRLVFEHVDAADFAELITRDVGKKGRLDLVVLVKDKNSQPFNIRPPFHPKEVARFHRLLLEARLDVQFESRHEFLLIIGKKDQLVGGVFWKKTGAGIAHLEKIVISPPYQKNHLSIRLIEELFNRLRLKKFKFLTVGFFQSGLFYRLGFEIDQKFGGLVKKL